MKMKWKRALGFVTLLGACAIAALGAVSWHVQSSGAAHVRPGLVDLSHAPCAIVLGARVKPTGLPSDVLADRLQQAVLLYRTGKARKLLLSGDHGRKDYDEVNCMRRAVLQAGISPADIFCDHAGFDTYDSLFRAREVFGVKQAIVVTQAFHLPRALYIARGLGIEAEGTPCDQRRYLSRHWNTLREAAARVKAFADVALIKSSPRFLGAKIPIEADGRASWDEGL